MDGRKILKFLLLCCGMLVFVSGSSTHVQNEAVTLAINSSLRNAVEKYGVPDVSEVLKLPEYFLNRFLCENVQYDCIIKAFNNFENENSISLEAFLAQQYETVQIVSPIKSVDRDWEEKFQMAAKAQLLLPQEFKNPITINKYLAFLRGIDPFFEPWLHAQLHLHTISFASDVMNTAENYRVYEAIRDYYRTDGVLLSVVLAIKAAEEKKKREAEEWHFSDVLHWLPFGSKAPSTASSSRSSNEGTPPNRSFGSEPSPDKKSTEQMPLLAAAEHKTDGLRKRR